MPKASPLLRSFNGGEFSALLAGRPDLDRYPASMRRMYNFIAAPQGPAICRSGTAMVATAYNHAEKSSLVPFVFSDEQAKMLEFAEDRIRFLDEDGIQVYAGVATTTTTTAPFVINSATLGASVGDEVVLDGYPTGYNLNGEIVKITAKAGDDYTLDFTWPVGKASAGGEASRVYHVDCTYTEVERAALNYLQSVDVVYLLVATRRTRKLSRYDTYDWRLTDVEFKDGPYMPVNETTTTLTPSVTGNALPDMTSNTLPSGTAGGSGAHGSTNGGPPDTDGEKRLNRTIFYDVLASDFYHAFDADDETFWASDAAQTGIIQITPATAFACTGYTIYAALFNRDTDYLAKDYAPGTWTFEGYDGTDWVILDSQENYVLYDNNKSVFFELNNETVYSAYRLNITKTTRNGLIEPRVRKLVLRSDASASLDLVASDTTGINNDTGFQTTDVGRLIRVKGTDGAWRALKITARNSTTSVTVDLQGEPFLNLRPIKEWRLGYWSDTTGWPTTGDFFEDRLWLAPCTAFPDMFAGSVVGLYETFAQTDTFGVVDDDSAVVARLNSRKLSRIRWLTSDEKGLLIGTGSGEYILASAKGEVEAVSARNIKSRNSTSRGSADVTPVKVDRQVLYVQRSGRTLREFAYVFEADGYKSPSMSQLASHLGVKRFVEMDYAAEPHSLVWVRREDGTVVGLTYNRDENVIGWHQHDFSSGVVESLAVMPQADQLQDALWMQIRRTINGQTRRYIERLTRFWDFDTTIAEAHYVDSALRYQGVATDIVYGLQHLEGEEVYGLADGRPFGPLTVADGKIELSYEAENIIIGLGYDSEGESNRLENGAADGTAFGKVKRMHKFSLGVWSSYGGEIGVWNTEERDPDTDKPGYPVYEPIEYPAGRFDEIEDIELYTGEIGPITPEAGYEVKGSVFFRRPKNSPLPFNVTYIAPQMHTQDAG